MNINPLYRQFELQYAMEKVGGFCEMEKDEQLPEGSLSEPVSGFTVSISDSFLIPLATSDSSKSKPLSESPVSSSKSSQIAERY